MSNSVSNNLRGVLPNEMTSLVELTDVQLPSNRIGGTLPEPIGNLSQLARLSLGDNQNLQGTLPPSLWTSLTRKLRTLQLEGNRFSGTLSSEISNLSNLLLLHLESNRLSGTIPSSLGTLSELSKFILYYYTVCTTDYICVILKFTQSSGSDASVSQSLLHWIYITLHCRTRTQHINIIVCLFILLLGTSAVSLTDPLFFSSLPFSYTTMLCYTLHDIA
jgi:hypothetical protein